MPCDYQRSSNGNGMREAHGRFIEARIMTIDDIIVGKRFRECVRLD